MEALMTMDCWPLWNATMSNHKNGNKCRDSWRLASALESQHGQAVSLYTVEGMIVTVLRQFYHPDPGDKWIFAPARLHDARSEFGYVVYENQIYCFGGRGVSTIECYDYVNEHWRVVGRVGENTYSINCVLYPPLSFSNVPSLSPVPTS